MGGYLHDIGKVGIPDRILLKDGQLTADEYELMKGHTLIGDHLCAELRLLKRIRPIVRHHHEHLDGSGYPDGLAGDAVPLLAPRSWASSTSSTRSRRRVPTSRRCRSNRRATCCGTKCGAAGAEAISSVRSSRCWSNAACCRRGRRRFPRNDV